MSWLLHVFGIDTTTGPWYAFYSGFGALVIPPLITAAPIVWVLLRKHNCHQPRCWRVGRLPVQGTAYVVCKHHHPSPPEEHTIRERYHLYAGRRPGRG